MFPDDRFWNLGYPTGRPWLAVNWSVGKNWNALVLKELNLVLKPCLGELARWQESCRRKASAKCHITLGLLLQFPAMEVCGGGGWDANQNNAGVKHTQRHPKSCFISSFFFFAS